MTPGAIGQTKGVYRNRRQLGQVREKKDNNTRVTALVVSVRYNRKKKMSIKEM